MSSILNIQANFDLKGLTTFNVGGASRFFILAEDLAALNEALKWSGREKIPWFLIGHGSNLLVSDQGFSGLVIKLGRRFDDIKILENENTVIAGGAVMLPRISSHLSSRGWSGFEYMCDIPGTVGGAVRMNAGIADGMISDNLVYVDVFTRGLKVLRYANSDMNFAHRYSRVAFEKAIVLSAAFKLGEKRAPETIKDRVNEIILKRRQKQPRNRYNCGSIFKNPQGGNSAGWYVEKAGLKGLVIGGAMIAEEHANWIVNLGKATSEDVKNLISLAQNKVREIFNVMLEREIVYVPEDSK